jgi:hypothetical protein
MTAQRIRSATRDDLRRIHTVRHGTAENRLLDPTLVTDAEVAWYMDAGIFLVSEDADGVRGFTCVNPQTGYVWALFVIDEAQGRGCSMRRCNGCARAGTGRRVCRPVRARKLKATIARRAGNGWAPT